MEMLIFLQKPTSSHDKKCQIKWDCKPWRFLQGDIENENQLTLLVKNYKKLTREI